MFRLHFETANSAFDNSLPDEIARILRHVAGQIEDGATKGRIYDRNGNPVGTWQHQEGLIGIINLS